MIVAIAGLLATVAIALPKMVVGDTWLALVDGRWIANHGLPHTDALTVWTYGTIWTDQQWLAHLVLYDVARVGGLKLTLVLAMVLDASAIVIAAIAARRSGGSTRSVAVCLLAAIIVAPWGLQARTQSFALPLFVAVYMLLASDSRKQSRRVFLVLPLLVLWENLHGSALLGAGLVFVLGVLTARRRPLRGLALATGALASLVVSPYGVDLVGYYHRLLIGSPLPQYIDEWQPTAPSFVTAAFFAVAFSSTYLLARHGHAVSRFERVALPLLVLAGLIAGRNTLWLGLGFAVSGPLLLDLEWPSVRALEPRIRRVNLRLSTIAVVVAAGAIGARFAQPEAALLRAWPSAGADAVASAADGTGRVLADDEHSDWLLWKKPELTRRIAYDIRFELFNAKQFGVLQAFREGVAQSGPTVDYRVLTFETDREASRFLGQGHIVYRSPRFIVVRRSG